MPVFSKIAISIIALAIIVPASLLAWGPDRPTYTIEKPADHVTFDSITNNPDYGDERNFVTIKDATNNNAGGWTDEISVENNKEYYVQMYVHNNAADNLNLVAKDVTAKFNLPTYSAKRIQIDGYLSSSNASPSKIWDQAVFSGSNDFSLTYVPGSASYTNNVFPSGTALSDNIISNGVSLGYDKLDGNIPGCFKYSGSVIFKVKAVTNDYSVQKTVRINGATDKTFKESVAAKPNDKVDYQIYFKNIGGTQLKDVVVNDLLPSGMTYVKDSTYVHTSDGTVQVTDSIVDGGLNIGGYLPGGDAYIKFTASISSEKDLQCGTNTFVNKATVTTEVGSKEDTATVTVDKTCVQPPKECKPGIPEGDVRCNPVTPPELPHTGPTEDVISILGLGAMVASIGYYLASRRKSLNQ